MHMMNALITKKANKEAIALLKRQVRALKSVVKKGTGQESLLPIIEEKVSLLEYISKVKCWNFNFDGGGWNSNYAKTKEESIKMAKKEYKKSEHCTPDESTFRVATDADTAMLLSSFY